MSDHVYKHIELTGSSKTSIEDAVQTAIAKAALTLHRLQWFQVMETRGHITDGKVAHWQVTIKVGFTLDGYVLRAREASAGRRAGPLLIGARRNRTCMIRPGEELSLETRGPALLMKLTIDRKFLLGLVVGCAWEA
jgi:flavin-binding protein dodecin